MPLVDDCELSEQCCTSLYDVAAYLLVQSASALSSCYEDPTACPVTSLPKYVTFGPGNDGQFDALTVAYLTAGPQRQDARTLSLALYRATFEIRLRESGWPMVEATEGGIRVPDWTVQTNRARQAFAHGEKLYRHLIWLNNQRELPPPSFHCSNVQLGQLLPLQPLAGIIGFTVAVTMDVPWSGG